MEDVEQIADKDFLFDVEIKLNSNYNLGQPTNLQLRQVYKTLKDRKYFTSSFDLSVCLFAKYHRQAPVLFLLDENKNRLLVNGLERYSFEDVMEKIDIAEKIGFEAVGFGVNSFLSWSEEHKNTMRQKALSNCKSGGLLIMLYSVRDEDICLYKEFPILCVDFWANL